MATARSGGSPPTDRSSLQAAVLVGKQAAEQYVQSIFSVAAVCRGGREHTHTCMYLLVPGKMEYRKEGQASLNIACL